MSATFIYGYCPLQVGQLLQFPAGMPVASGPSAPSGPGSYPTMLAPRRPGEQHVSGATAQADGNAQPGAANGHAAEPAVSTHLVASLHRDAVSLALQFISR